MKIEGDRLWIDVEEDSNYEVSNLGDVRNKKTGRILKPHLNRPGGYLRVDINGEHKYIHRLVVNAFYDADIDGLYIKHLDGNKSNNAINNLEIIE